MKNIILKTTAILLILAGMVSCGKEDKKENTICNCNDKVNSAEITDVEGIINFNSDIQEWYISVYEENTYDVVKLLLPCNIENSYKKVNKKVLFSGIIFDLSTKITAPAGSDYACIEILSISNLP
ncbi:MAG: hypothetical protein LBF01_01440 [Bacteroidales bacterium]|jgi:hypothetical protein|nr:hypothetical protein [Bacteroidales bacterium]